ncbi:MAG: hypothetical protein J5715_04185 [Clostridiales bacterium]|nr:hypothetical protein [Clostridiales bacterium]
MEDGMWTRYTMCSKCGHRMRRFKDEWGLWDGMTYTCDFCRNEDDEEGVPEGCQACGGPYPNCIEGCNMFDD